jgi:hypothetical protein
MKKLLKVLTFVLTDKQALRYFGYALLVLVTLCALTYAAMLPLMREAKLVVTDTLPGLVYGAEMNSTMDDNFVRLLLMTEPQFRNELDGLVKQIEHDTQQNEAVISKYRESIFDEADRESFEAFEAQRDAYIAMRREFIAGLQAHPSTANVELKSTLLPAYQKYRDAGRELMKYNARIGQERSAHIQNFVIYAILFTLIAPLLIIFLGIVLGIKIFRL